jgi:hypothetical protein
MADYYPLIARAVAGLEKNTGEGRRVLYERARSALVTQLRGVVPALSESDITRERLALEEAIRKVEAEAARQSRESARPEPQPRRESERDEAARSSAPRRDTIQPPPAPNRTLAEPARSGAQPNPAPTRRPAGSRAQSSTAAEAGETTAQTSRSGRQVYAPAAQSNAEHARAEPRLEPEGLRPPRKPRDESAIDHPFEPTIGGSLESPMILEDAPPTRQRSQRAVAIPEELDAQRGQPQMLAGGGLLRALIAVSVVLLLGGAVFWQRQTIMAAVRDLAGLDRPSPVLPAPPREANLTRAKIPDRLAPSAQNRLPEAPIAQRVVLYEEDPTDPAGKQYVGQVTWRTETVSPGPGQPPDVVIRANIEIPDRQMKVTWSLRRNTDKSLPASHTVDLVFSLPSDFPHGGISNIPGLLMKQAEQTRGVPLAGQSVKVTTGYFLIGLSSVESDLQRNVQLLKERTWFDIPIVYTDGRRAILAVEKGSPGETAFAEAFNAWTQ